MQHLFGARGPLTILPLTCVCLGVAAPARSQIYTWHDANGTLMLSNHPPPGIEAAPEGTGAKSVNRPGSKVPAAPVTIAAVAPPSSTERNRISGEIDGIIEENARLNGISGELVRAVVHVESRFNPLARSPKGALGLMQLMPATIRQYGVRNPFDPAQNVAAGVRYLRRLLDRYGNNEELALAAYNAGPEAVDRHGQAVPPYRETRRYVAEISQLASRPPAPPTAEPRRDRIYKVVDVIEGRAVVRYTDQEPPAGSYDVVPAR
jgi:hypothetical protein